MTIRFRDDMFESDAAFDAEATELPSLFAECGTAIFAVMADLASVKPVETRKIRLEDDSLEMLLHRWLSELIFIKDRDSMLFREFEVRITGLEGKFTLESMNYGERIDQARHKLGSDVKGVSFYRLSVKQEGSLWKAFVVCDL